MLKRLRIKFKLTNLQIIALGFLGLILVGAILLSLPISSKDGAWTPLIDSLFTSTSATCVTGLIVYDTFTHWTLFGQLVILSLIQVGGIGFMTIVALFAFFTKRNIGLRERTLLMQSAGSLSVGGVVSLVRKIIFGTLIFEFTGAALLCISFIPKMGAVGIYYAIFHAISAFCNAGFDLMGGNAPFSSLTAYSNDPIVNITIMALIVLGGLGFLVWGDIIRHRFRFSRYRLHTKIVLTASAALIFGSAILFYIFERNHAFADMSTGESIMAAFFQAVAPRTAGFNTANLAELSESGTILTIALMLVGGSPGSTAGGIKTTTIMVLLMGMAASSRGNRDVTVFKRRLEDGIVRQASAILTLYLTAVITFTMIICAIESLPLTDVIFETASAAGTVGLTRGITPALGTISHILLMLLMYGGRVGGLTLALVLAGKRVSVPTERPVEKVLIG